MSSIENQTISNQTYGEKTSAFPVMAVFRIALAFPLCILGIFFNFLSFVVFLRRNSFRNRIYKYFKLYSLNNVFFNLLNMIYHFPIKTSVSRMHFLVYYYSFLLYMFHSFASILDCMILFERIILLTGRFKRFKVFSVYLICLAILILSAILNVPNLFYFQVDFIQNKRNNSQIDGTYSFSYTQFYLSNVGFLTASIQCLFRDLLFLVIKFSLSFTAIILFKRHFKRKSFLIHVHPLSSFNQATNLDSCKKTGNKFNNHATVLNKSEQNITKLVVTKCCITLITNILFMAFIFNARAGFQSAQFVIYEFFISFKNTFDIFIYLCLDKNFKKTLNEIICYKFWKNKGTIVKPIR